MKYLSHRQEVFIVNEAGNIEYFTIEGLTDKQIVKYQKDFWSTLNDRNKISKNILLNHHIQVVKVEDKKILKIDIPAADRHDKPVYIGTRSNERYL